MRKILAVVALLAVSLCASPKIICGKVVSPYGILNPDDKVKGVIYEGSVGNVIWSILLIETFIVPIRLMGYELYEPMYHETGCKTNPGGTP